MPGVHTFYDGSTMLQPLANIFGVETDKVNLVICMFLGVPLAVIHYRFFSASRVSRTVRIAFPPIVGIIFCYFCYGNAIKHAFANVAISFAIMHLSPPAYVHKCVFVFSMGYLVFIHWYRWYILTSYSIDVTGHMMVLVQKVTMIAFSLHDGRVKKKEELNEIQKREALTAVPPLLDYISYLYCFQTTLTGPMCFYTDYMNWIDGKNAIGKDGRVESPWRPMLVKLLQSAVFLAIILKLGTNFPPEVVVEPNYMRWDLFRWCLLFFFVIFLQRVQYYFAWVLADATCNASGFGFNGYDGMGRPRWDLMSNVRPFDVEMAVSLKDTLDSWNCCTMYWLRTVAYERTPKKYQTVATYLLSALWHGFFIGYYMSFLTCALMTVASRAVRRSVRPHFQSTRALRSFYDGLTFFATKVALQYATFPFVTMHLYPGLHIYKRSYFFLHVLCLLAIFVLPAILPPVRRKEPKTVATVNGNGEVKKVN